jgi:sRNA-binding carbon storage regulator CsrA
MHLFNRRPHDGSSSVIQIGEGLNLIEVEILEVIGEQVIVGVFAPGETPVQRKEVVLERQSSEQPQLPTVQ